MENIKLISVDLCYNYVEPGDKLYITTNWQNLGEKPNFSARIAADIVFCERHRREENQNNNFRITWMPFPETDRWDKGEVWSSTGVWNVPSTWGASFMISLSLIDENGKTIGFLGKNEARTYSQEITETDIGWGWGRRRLLEQRKSVSIVINPESVLESTKKEPKTLEIGNYKFNMLYPSICGFKEEKWYDIAPAVTVRRISDNSSIKFLGNHGINYSVTSDTEKIIYYAKNKYCSFKAEFTFINRYAVLNISDICESDDYELISVDIPSLVQMSEKDTVLTNYFAGGRMANLTETLTQSVKFAYDVCNALSVSSCKGAFCLLANDVDNILRQSVIQNGNARKTAVLGAEIRTHIKANVPDMKSIPVKLQPLELHFDLNGDWKISSQLLKEKIPADVHRIYENTMIYKIMLDASGQYNPEKPETYIHCLMFGILL